MQSTPKAAPSTALPAALAGFDSLPDSAFVRLPVVCGLFACSPATVWRRVKTGRIPAPVKIGENSTGWRAGEIRQALAL